MWAMQTERSETTINWMDCEMRTQASSQKVFCRCPWLLNQASFINVFVYEVEFLWLHHFRFVKTQFPAFLPQFFLKKIQADTQDVSVCLICETSCQNVDLCYSLSYSFKRKKREKRKGKGEETSQ